MDVDLLAPFDFEGIFWNGDRRAKRITGILRYRPSESLKLELSSNPFGNSSVRVSGKRDLFGQFHNGTYVTLFDTFISSSKLNVTGRGGCIITCNGALVGEALRDAGQRLYCGIDFSLSSLEGWCGKSIFNIENRKHGRTAKWPSDSKKTGIEIKHLAASATLYNFCSSNFTYREMELKHVAGWSVKFNRAHHNFIECSNIATTFQNFFALHCGAPVALRRLHLLHPANPKSSFQKTSQYVGVSIFEKQVKELHPAEILVPFSGDRLILGKMLDSWFRAKGELAHAIGLFFGSMYRTPDTGDLMFLVLAHAVEVFHRCQFGGTYMDRAAYKIAYEAIVQSIPTEICGDHRVSLKKRLEFGNEFSLRKRLNDLLSRMSPEFKNWLTNGRKEFVDLIVNTRNYYTHYTDGNNNRPLRGMKLRIAAERLRLLLWAELLSVCGVPRQDAEKKILNNTTFQWWCEQELV